MCVGNLASRFSAKLVHFFLATYVVDNLRQYSDDLKQFDDGVNNVSVCWIYSHFMLRLSFTLPSCAISVTVFGYCIVLSIHAFVSSRIDYCNAVLAESPKATTDRQAATCAQRRGSCRH